VVVFERDDAVGGILPLRVPEFKLKENYQARLKFLEKEGIKFKTKMNIGMIIKPSN